MFKIIKTHIDINGIVINKVTYYLVTYIITYEISLFGLFPIEFTKNKELPFLFMSLDIAKDFCKINPTYKKTEISNYSEDFHGYYKTYELTINKKFKAYIVWNLTMRSLDIDYETHDIKTPYPIVKGFIDNKNNIKFPNSWLEANNNRNLKIYNINEKLSDIFYISETDNYQFELLENN